MGIFGLIASSVLGPFKDAAIIKSLSRLGMKTFMKIKETLSDKDLAKFLMIVFTVALPGTIIGVILLEVLDVDADIVDAEDGEKKISINMMERGFLSFEQKPDASGWVCRYGPEGEQKDIELKEGIDMLLEKFNPKSFWKKESSAEEE